MQKISELGPVSRCETTEARKGPAPTLVAQWHDKMAAFPTSRGTCVIADRQQPCPPRRHCHWTAALVLAFLATTAVPATAQAQQTAPVSAVTAAADCPCLTPQEVSQRAAGHIRHPDPAKAPNVTCLDAGIDRPCLPPDFGSGSCGEWNFYIDPACQSDDHRPMCDMQWCFVVRELNALPFPFSFSFPALSHFPLPSPALRSFT